MSTSSVREAGGAGSADPDHAVLVRVADGDLDAFEELVRRHQDRLHRLCERMLHDREEARDATQDVFVKVFRKAGRFEPRGKVSTWMYRIAVNHCLNVLRRRKIVRMIPLVGGGGEDEEPREWLPRDDAPGPDRRLAARRRWAATRRAIDGLPPTQRAVLVLAKFEGLAYKEIAEVLGITGSAVESRLFRAMRNLEKAQGTDPPGVS